MPILIFGFIGCIRCICIHPNIKIDTCAKIKPAVLLGWGYNVRKTKSWLSEHFYKVIAPPDENYVFYSSNGDTELLAKRRVFPNKPLVYRILPIIRCHLSKNKSHSFQPLVL